MRFAYKINSSYNGFTPGVIPERMKRRRLVLGWKRYIESVEPGAEVWVHFRGPDRYTDGVYIYGTAKEVDLGAREVTIHVDRHSTDEPLTDPAISEAVARVVDTPYRQVFVLPEDLLRVYPCDILGTAGSCGKRRCGQCLGWNRLPRVAGSSVYMPARLEEAGALDLVPAYWVIARRSWGAMHQVRQGIHDTTDVFNRFKGGDGVLAYPLARGIVHELKKHGYEEADYLVPIPLSPDKAAQNELHRTLALANEISQLLGIPVRQALSLDRPISKRALDVSADEFERRYAEAISAAGMRPAPGRVILVDDVCTRGSTLAVATRAIRGRFPDCEVIAVTAGQMTMTDAIAEPKKLLHPAAN